MRTPASADAADTGSERRRLWSNPSAPLPDVFVSDTSFFLDEGQSRQYTIALSTAPGMREDTTVRRAALLPCAPGVPPDHVSSSRARRSIWTTTRSGST